MEQCSEWHKDSSLTGMNTEGMQNVGEGGDHSRHISGGFVMETVAQVGGASNRNSRHLRRFSKLWTVAVSDFAPAGDELWHHPWQCSL